MNVLFASSEIYPFSKSGGLADVAHALPRALDGKAQMTVVTPLYRFTDRASLDIVPSGIAFPVAFGGKTYPVTVFESFHTGIRTLLIESMLLSDRDSLYGSYSAGYEDNDLRFAIFCHAVIELAERLAIELLHLNDWHTALAALLAQALPRRPKILFTIHNLAYQGLFPAANLQRLGIEARYFTMEGVEFYGKINLMKAGIAYADWITTVSPTYAQEIRTKTLGFGLEGFLRHHESKLSGVLNGIDVRHFNPQNDPALYALYDAENPGGKQVNKARFLQSIGLDDPLFLDRPLFIFIGRMTIYKGIDLIIEAIKTFCSWPVSFALLGEGESHYHNAFVELAHEHPNIHLQIGYDESLSHRMYAAADFLVMPSLFEACGLNQMIAMRYGTVPIVHKTGGLADSVYDMSRFEEESSCGHGFCFERSETPYLLEAMHRALTLYHDRKLLEATRVSNMRCDVSFAKSAQTYLELYTKLVGQAA